MSVRKKWSAPLAGAVAVAALVIGSPGAGAAPPEAQAGSGSSVSGRLSYVVSDPVLGPEGAKEARESGHRHPSASRTTATVTIDGRTVEVSPELVRDIPAGEVRVSLRDPGAALRSGSDIAAVAPARPGAPATYPGMHHVTVVPVYWDTAPTVDAATTRATMSEVAEYYEEQTFGTIEFTLDSVTAPLKISLSAADIAECNPWPIEQKVRASLGSTPKDPNHHIVALMQRNENCWWGGLANIGPGEQGDAFVWINDYPQASIWTHEFGHNLGLPHSNGLTCWSDPAHTKAVTFSRECEDMEYQDPWDFMGNGWWGFGAMNAINLERLGVLQPGGRRRVVFDETVTLQPVVDGTGLRSVEVALPDSLLDLEYRVARGRDAWIDDETYSSGGVTRTSPGEGVVVRRQPVPGYSGQPWSVLNMHPYGDGLDFQRHPALDAGESYALPGGELRIDVLTATDTQATVRLRFRTESGVYRWAGDDRYEVSALIAGRLFADPAKAYVASGEVFTDALSGAPAAGAVGAPMVLTKREHLPEASYSYLDVAKPAVATILGGPASVGPFVEELLEFMAGQVRRIAGADRYVTSAAISADSFAPGVPVAFVASGEVFPDALSGAPLAGRDKNPVLLTAANRLPSSVAAELKRLRPKSVVVLGGPVSVSEDVLSAIGTAAGVTPQRWSGPDRYAVSALVSQNSYPTGADTVFVSSGEKFPDALSGAPAASLMKAPMLLVRHDRIPPQIAAELERLRPSRIIVLGGEASVERSVTTALGGYLS